jgi:hypothetical protein
MLTAPAAAAACCRWARNAAQWGDLVAVRDVHRSPPLAATYRYRGSSSSSSGLQVMAYTCCWQAANIPHGIVALSKQQQQQQQQHLSAIVS